MRKILLSATTFFLILTSRAQWLQQNPGFTKDTVGFYEISLPDKNTAWAVCYDGWGGLLSGKPILILRGPSTEGPPGRQVKQVPIERCGSPT
jgi:hypothetical protein